MKKLFLFAICLLGILISSCGDVEVAISEGGTINKSVEYKYTVTKYLTASSFLTEQTNDVEWYKSRITFRNSKGKRVSIDPHNVIIEEN